MLLENSPDVHNCCKSSNFQVFITHIVKPIRYLLHSKSKTLEFLFKIYFPNLVLNLILIRRLGNKSLKIVHFFPFGIYISNL